MQGCCGRHCAQPAAQCNGQTVHRAPVPACTHSNLFYCLTHLTLRHDTVHCTSESSARILSGHHFISVTLRLLLSFLPSGSIEKNSVMSCEGVPEVGGAGGVSLCQRTRVLILLTGCSGCVTLTESEPTLIKL